MKPITVPEVALTLLRSLGAAEAADDLDNAEVVFESGGGWHQGTERVSPNAARWLIRHVMLRLTSEPRAKLERWELNEYGREAARTGVIPDVVLAALKKCASS